MRAEAALTASPPPAFAPSKLFLPRNLFPFLIALGLMFAATAPQTEAQNATEGPSHASVSGPGSYRSGDFSAAEAFWRNALKSPDAPPTVPYNLSLALAQQNRWDEAAAQASAAFVQDPANPAVRWQFTLACDKAGVAPAPLVDFVTPGPMQLLARMASPPIWQWAMAGTAVLMAAALAFGLALAYRARSGGRAALIAAGAALLLFLTAAAGWRAYGLAADSRAVVVWRAGILRSIPTEAEVAQKTQPLAAGSVAIVNKSFLGWVRLSFENGETGWVRVEEVVPFWSGFGR
jgi:tetratricopeptide (TPR) repeat protein